MSKLPRVLAAAILLSLGLAVITPPVEARSLAHESLAGSGESAPRGVAAMANDGVTLDEAVSQAGRQVRARGGRTDVPGEDGRKVYVLKLLSEDGRVFTVRIDAATGRMR